MRRVFPAAQEYTQYMPPEWQENRGIPCFAAGRNANRVFGSLEPS